MSLARLISLAAIANMFLSVFALELGATWQDAIWRDGQPTESSP
jgi:hypothetical protein